MLKAILSWAIVAWICKVFLTSIPYKFTQHPDTQHIFGTIGEWLGGITTSTLGNLFSSVGPFAVGGFELLTSLVLLLPALLVLIKKLSGGQWRGIRARWHAIGGLMAAMAANRW